MVAEGKMNDDAFGRGGSIWFISWGGVAHRRRKQNKEKE